MMSSVHVDRGRLAHHRHFTFKSVSGEKAVTLVTDGVDGAFADEHQPFSCQDSWLQVYCSEQFSRDLLHSLQPILNEPLVQSCMCVMLLLLLL